MKINDFTENIREEIRTDIENCLMRFGINTKIHMTDRTLRNGEAILIIDSDSFQTQPCLFKSVKIEGSGHLTEDEEGGYELFFVLDFRYETFTGGSNGTHLCNINFRLSDNSTHIVIRDITF